MENNFECVHATKITNQVEMCKLGAGLAKRGIKFDMRAIWDGFQIITKDWDVVCHGGSYGYEKGLLEVMGPDWLVPENEDGVEGWLTAEEILRRIDLHKEQTRPTCPTGDLDCPYFDFKSGECHMYDEEGCGPRGECDEYDYFQEEDDDEEEEEDDE